MGAPPACVRPRSSAYLGSKEFVAMKRMLGETLAVAVAALGLLASCSSSTSESSGSATVTGTINSTAFSFASGFAVR